MDTVLVVEDDEATAAFLAENLEADGFRVAVAGAASEAIRAIAVRAPDLVILDVMLADGNGLAVLDAVRRDGGAGRVDPAVPVLVLSGRGGEIDRVRGFARGADDYVVKPFSYPELVARVRALLRRAKGGGRRRGVLKAGALIVDPAARTARVGERCVRLSGKEFALLHALAAEPTRVVPKGELLRDVWGYKSVGATRTVDAHASRLRKKLGPGYVLNVRGVGYRLLESP